MFFSKKKVEKSEEQISLWSMFAKIPMMLDMAAEVAGPTHPNLLSEWFPETEESLSGISKQEYESLENQGVDVDKIKTMFMNRRVIVNSRLDKNQRKPIPLSQSKSALILIQKFESANIMHTTPFVKVDPEGFSYILSDIYGNDESKWPPANCIQVRMPLSSGKVLNTSIEFYEDQNGEFAFWYSDLLVSNLPTRLNNKVDEAWLDVNSFQPHILADKLFLPTSITNLAFIAENRLYFENPLVPSLFPREYFFSAEGSGDKHQTEKLSELLESEKAPSAKKKSALPAPGIVFLENASVTACGFTSEEEWRECEFLAPNAIRLGWTFDVNSLETEFAINSFFAMFMRAGNCLDEGYTKYQGAVQENEQFPDPQLADYHYVFLGGQEPILGEPEGEHVEIKKLSGYQTWIPQIEASEFFFNTWERLHELEKDGDNHSNGRSTDNNKREVLFEAVREGLGVLPHAISTLVYSVLLPDLVKVTEGGFKAAALREKIIKQIDLLCTVALLLPISSQQANALCNAGIARYVVGELDRAENLLLAALNHPSKNNEDEASFFLHLIYSEEGNDEQARKYLERSVAAGGYDGEMSQAANVLVAARKAAREQNDQVDKARKSLTDGSFGLDANQDVSTESPSALEAVGPTLQGKSKIGNPKSKFGSDTKSSAPKNFCTECGNAFAGDLEKFCSQCGSKR